MKYSYPIRDFKWNRNVSQFFGVNPETYKQFLNDDGEPLAGHNGLDIIILGTDKLGYGEDVLSVSDGQVVNIVYDNPEHTRGAGIYVRERLDGGSFREWVYWHLSSFTAYIGQTVRAGDVIGKVGNSGFVFPKPSPACPYCGSHLHLAMRNYDYAGRLIKTDYGSGYADPTPILFEKCEDKKLGFYFPYDMTIFSKGNSVSALQTILRIEGFAQDYNPIGYFGRKTLRDVILLQKKYNITPWYGYVGPKTRKFLNSKYA